MSLTKITRGKKNVSMSQCIQRRKKSNGRNDKKLRINSQATGQNLLKFSLILDAFIYFIIFLTNEPQLFILRAIDMIER
jgi:hypothetical protein